jgi:hypothetical protein
MDDNRNADQVSKAADEAKGRLGAATETVSDLAGKAGTAAAEAASTIQSAASETAKQVSDAAAKTFKQGAQAQDGRAAVGCAPDRRRDRVFDRIHVVSPRRSLDPRGLC